MKSVFVESLGDLQFLKYEFAPRVRFLIKEVHQQMNAYNSEFFAQCKKVSSSTGFEKEAFDTGELPLEVKNKMIEQDLFKPILSGIELKLLANRIKSFCDYHSSFWNRNILNVTSVKKNETPEERNRRFYEKLPLERTLKTRALLGDALFYTFFVPFASKINKNKLFFDSKVPFLNRLFYKPYYIEYYNYTGDDVNSYGVVERDLIATDIVDRIPLLSSILRLGSNFYRLGSYTVKEVLSEFFYFYFLMNNSHIKLGEAYRHQAPATNYYFFSKKDFYTLSEECVFARIYDFFSNPIAVGSNRNDIYKIEKNSIVCDYFSDYKKKVSQGSFQDRVRNYEPTRTMNSIYSYDPTVPLEHFIRRMSSLIKTGNIMELYPNWRGKVYNGELLKFGVNDYLNTDLNSFVKKVQLREQLAPTGFVTLSI